MLAGKNRIRPAPEKFITFTTFTTFTTFEPFIQMMSTVTREKCHSEALQVARACTCRTSSFFAWARGGSRFFARGLGMTPLPTWCTEDALADSVCMGAMF